LQVTTPAKTRAASFESNDINSVLRWRGRQQ